jgi:hypothetical protein
VAWKVLTNAIYETRTDLDDFEDWVWNDFIQEHASNINRESVQ